MRKGRIRRCESGCRGEGDGIRVSYKEQDGVRVRYGREVSVKAECGESEDLRAGCQEEGGYSIWTRCGGEGVRAETWSKCKGGIQRGRIGREGRVCGGGEGVNDGAS